MREAITRSLLVAAVGFSLLAAINLIERIDPNPDDVVASDVAKLTHTAARSYLNNLADVAQRQADLPEDKIPDTVLEAMKPVQSEGETAKLVLRADLAKIMSEAVGNDKLNKKKWKALHAEMAKGYRK